MASLERLSEEFDETTRVRGRNFFQRGAVTLTRQTHRSVSAAVLGERRFEVEIDWDSGYFDYQCDCDDYQLRGQGCKHIWATLLAAQNKGKLPNELAFDELSGASVGAKSRRPPAWKQRLAAIKEQMTLHQTEVPEPWPTGQELVYVIDLAASLDGGGILVDLMVRRPRRENSRRNPDSERLRKLRQLKREQLILLPEVIDRQILQMLAGSETGESAWGYSPWTHRELPCSYRLKGVALETALKLMCQSGRCRLRRHRDDAQPTIMTWDDAGAWRFAVGLKWDAGSACKVRGILRRGEEEMDLSEPDMIVAGGLLFARGKLAMMEDSGAMELITMLRRDQKLAAPPGQERELLAELFSLPHLPDIELPEEMGISQIRPSPRPRLKIRSPKEGQYPHPNALRAELDFEYDGHWVAPDQAGSAIFLSEKGILIHRDSLFERQAGERLHSLMFRRQHDFLDRRPTLMILPRALPPAVRELTKEGWRIEADGKLYRSAGKIKIEVRSGIDWFEVHATADFGGTLVPLPRLLAALRKGENTIVLDDGALGILPEDWLNKYGLLAGVGEEKLDHLVFKKTQAGLLDALLASQEDVSVDEKFSEAREALREFEGVRAVEPPAGFIGELRHYQKEGLGWMEFLREFGFGGCLADDMGLGKTVQVLAGLQDRKERKCGPSLVVVPRSLIFNWKAEAAKFAPTLRVLDHTGATRSRNTEHFADYDFILTTYGTVRNDAPFLMEREFDYIVLDEAQAVKNSSSESAKAVRLLNGKHRLALSGTPVQNHLGELWSLFEFLNPGMLGASTALAGAAVNRTVDPEAAAALGRALRPFILRRTKGEVARELPERLEQTIFCDLDPAQRKLYDELRDHYRQALWTKIEQDGLGKSKIMVLEALLRLRQVACHPGLVDKTRLGESSAKLDTLMSRLEEIHEEGHKVLVFSQFTSLLSIVRDRLDADKIPYEYLDGKTQDRQERVERFQTDPECKLFLISLKAGGLGLNLTAAEYVFLLDPWWNPAVEAQAIDRAHRIGQTQRVFAYRLITRDTVEQKVLELQKTKRDLADAIITADNRTLATLKREDLELLLS